MPRPNRYDPLGYDLSLFNDFSVNMKAASGPQLVAEAARRHLTDRLFWDETYGIELPQRIRRQQPSTYPALAEEARQELLKDERIADVRVVISPPDVNRTVHVSVDGVCSDERTFQFVMSVSQLTVDQITFTQVSS